VRRGRARRCDDRGSSGTEFVILFPLIVVLLLGGPQLAMQYFAHEAAQAAALAGARAASALNAPPGAGRDAANTYLEDLGSGTITSFSTTETRTATTVTIHVHARVSAMVPLPGFDPTVDVTVVRQRERFTTPDSP
jgi:Flp pilus assembly protein TadG